MANKLIKKTNNTTLNETLLNKGYNKLVSEYASIYLKDKDFAYIDFFLNNKIDVMGMVKNLPGVESAFLSFTNKIARDGQHILIVSDFDCDGITSAMVAKIILEEKLHLKLNVTVLINKRKNGTGYNKKLVEDIIEINEINKIDLLISFDHGSANEKEFKFLKENIKNLTIILTDHHIPDAGNMPKSVDAYVNPHLTSLGSTELNISGCCVGFLTLMYIYAKLYNRSFKELAVDLIDVLPYVSLSILSDIMPLDIPINRYMATLGFHVLNSKKDYNWEFFKNKLNINGDATFEDINFKLIPLINSGNRTNSEELIFNMLCEKNILIKSKLFNVAINNNNYRKIELQRSVKKILEQLKKIDTRNPLVLVVNTKSSINGLIANDIGSIINRPCACFGVSRGGDYLYGSIRGIVKKFNIIKILENIKKIDDSILVEYGGHEGAGGCKIYSNRFEDFKNLFIKLSNEELELVAHEDDYLEYDIEVPPEGIGEELLRSQDLLEPFGKMWPKPLFYSTIKLISFKNISNKYLILDLDNRENKILKGRYWLKYDIGAGKKIMNYTGKNIKILYNLTRDIYRGGGLLVDIRRILEVTK